MAVSEIATSPASRQPEPRAVRLEPSVERTGTAPALDGFASSGYLKPFPLVDAAHCRALAARVPTVPVGPLPRGWDKALATSDAMVHDIGADPRVLALLRPILGEDIVLWGASVIARKPGQVHSWHSDVESMRPEGGFVSVWIGLENTGRDSSLNVVSGSHRVGNSLQELLYRSGLTRADADDSRVLSWAQSVVPEAEIVVPDMADGDAIVFDGRLWHGSRNRRTAGTRKALLLQYCAADIAVHAPIRFDWPVAFDTARPPVVAVSGRPGAANLVVPRPPEALPRPSALGARFNDARPLFRATPELWSYHPDFEGSTANLRHVTGHVSVLAPGATPHAPHVHAAEEILLVLDGEAEIIHPGTGEAGATRTHRLGPGAFAYTPAFSPHTLRNPSADRSVTYLAYKWTGRPRAAAGAMATQVVRPDWATPFAGTGFKTRTAFEGPTGYLERLHAHVTELDAGAGYARHADRHDVAIVVFAGRARVRGRELAPGGMVFLPGGVGHGMENVGTERARYLVIEFHSPPQEQRAPSSLARLTHELRTRRWPGRSLVGRIYRGVAGIVAPRGATSS